MLITVKYELIFNYCVGTFIALVLTVLTMPRVTEYIKKKRYKIKQSNSEISRERKQKVSAEHWVE